MIDPQLTQYLSVSVTILILLHILTYCFELNWNAITECIEPDMNVWISVNLIAFIRIIDNN